MGPSIAATAYGAAAILAAWLLRPRFASNASILRALVFWLVSIPILFMLAAPLASLVACGIALALLAPKTLEERAAFYLMTFVAVPVSMGATVPFPGINYLVVLDFAKIAAIVLLAPAIMFAPAPNSARYAPAAGIVIVILTLLYSLQEFRDANLTSGLRASLDNLLKFALPFAAIVRLLPAREVCERVFACFVMIAVIFFFSAAISQATSWNFYSYLVERQGVPQFADVRAGLLRVGVTTVPTFAAYVATLGLVAVEYFRAQRRCGFLYAWTYRAMFLTAAFFTQARGGWLAMAVGGAVYLFFAKAPRSIRPVVAVPAALIGVPFALVYLLGSDLSKIDRYGSFEYRRELLKAAWVQVRQKPLFGDSNYLASGNFDHLVQGQGIIDVVNHYVQIVLEHGLVGLGLYLGAFAIALAGLLGLGKEVKKRPRGDALELQRAVILAAVVSYLVMMGTISAVSFGSHLGVLLLAISTAFVAAARKERALERGKEAACPDPARAATEAAKGDLYA